MMSTTRKVVIALAPLLAVCCCALAQQSATQPAAAQEQVTQVNPWVAPGPGGRLAQLCEDEAAEGTLLSRTSSVSLRVYGSEHFVLFHAAQDTWARRMGELLEKAQTNFRASIRQAGFETEPPGARLIWVCFRGMDDFDQYSRQSDQVDMTWTDGYYSARTNRVALVLPSSVAPRQGDGVELAGSGRVAQFGPQPDSRPAGDERLDPRWITHELAHQLSFNCGLQKRGVTYPLWLSEGLATNFESDNDGRFGFGRDNPPRRRTLLNAYTRGRLTSLRRFVMLDHLEAGGEAQARQDYAQCWGLYRFLSQERPAQLRQYLQGLKALEAGSRDGTELRREFIEAFGPMDRVDADWQNWLDGLLADTDKPREARHLNVAAAPPVQLP